MGKRPDRKPIEELLAENFSRWRQIKRPVKLGVAPKTANNVEKGRHDTKLSTLESLAESLGIQSYQLLLPESDEKFLALIEAWEQSDTRGRGDLQAIAEAILKRRESGAVEQTTVATTVHRRRDGSG